MLTGNSSLLRNALLVDSIVSFLTGVALLLFSKSIASFLGLSAAWIVLVLGVVAIAYSIAIYLAARAEHVHMGIARLAAYGNLIGAFGIAVLIFANLMPLTTAGKWAVAIVADAVLVLAVFPHVGLRRVGG